MVVLFTFQPGNDPYAFVEFAEHTAAAAALLAMNKRNCMNRVSTLSLRLEALRGKNNMQKKYQGMNTHRWSQLWSQQSNNMCWGGGTVASSKNAAFLLLIICKHELFPCNTHHTVGKWWTIYILIIILLSFLFVFISFYWYIICSVTNYLCEELKWIQRFGDLFPLLFLTYIFAHVRQLRSSSWDDLLLDGQIFMCGWRSGFIFHIIC